MKSNIQECEENVDSLLEKVKELSMKISDLKRELAATKDENESLWGMLDEIKKSDIEEHQHLLKDLEMEAKLQSMMLSTKKGLA